MTSAEGKKKETAHRSGPHEEQERHSSGGSRWDHPGAGIFPKSDKFSSE